jgi:hypothetical protein
MISNYLKFINESKFLKNIHLLGYLEIKYYPNIDNIMNKFKEGNDFISDDKEILWDFLNEDITDSINKFMFKTETQQLFNLEYLKFTREPIKVSEFNFNKFVEERVNHYMIKTNNSDEYIWGDLEYSDDIKKFVNKCISFCDDLGISTNERYCYITIDQKNLEFGKSQRDFGWHIDGLQGDEVPQKKMTDFQFIWCDSIPTKFCTQVFKVEGLNLSTHNVFNWLGKQVEEDKCYLLEKIVFMP